MTLPTDHQDFAELAPFYVAGTLSPDEAARFEAALVEDTALARNVAAARSERDEVVALNEALPVPSARAFDLLFARIDAEPARRPGLWHRLDLGARLAEFFSPQTLGWAVAAACLVLAVQAGFLVTDHEKNPSGGYGTASIPRENMAGAGIFALIVFSPNANADAISALLDKTGAQIVEGPLTGGFYRLRIGGPDQAAAETQRRLGLLRNANGVVRFVSPSP
ncbi:MAG TPA: hypothetical protein VGG12_05490 [Methylovirgula sp.]|jgi:anti-sigma-K factor RskA